MTRITIEGKYGKTIVEDVRDDLDIYEMMNLIERALLAESFPPDVVKDGFIGKTE